MYANKQCANEKYMNIKYTFEKYANENHTTGSIQIKIYENIQMKKIRIKKV